MKLIVDVFFRDGRSGKYVDSKYTSFSSNWFSVAMKDGRVYRWPSDMIECVIEVRS